MKLTKEQKEIIEYIQSLFDKPIYLCGGAIRDILLGKEVNDYDFCSPMSTDEVKECLKDKHRAYCIGERYGTIGFIYLGQKMEITRFRIEEYITNSRKPNVTFGTDLQTDLSRRDFTIGAMCINCKTLEFIDPFNGKQDLEDGIIRAVGHARTRFQQDPLRLLRAIRFSTTLGFRFEEVTKNRIKDMGYSLQRISRERWVQEFNKILQSDNVYKGLKMLWKYRIFNFTIPELAIQWNYKQNSKYHNLQLWEHTAKVVESAQKAGEDLPTLYACLLHDIGKCFVRTDKWEDKGQTVINPTNTDNLKYIKTNYVHHESVGSQIAYRILDYLKFSTKDKNKIVEIIRNHLKDDSPIRKYDNAHKAKPKDL